MSLAENVDYLRRLSKLNGLNNLETYARNLRPAVHSPLVEVTGFASNPGDLRRRRNASLRSARRDSSRDHCHISRLRVWTRVGFPNARRAAWRA